MSSASGSALERVSSTSRPQCPGTPTRQNSLAPILPSSSDCTYTPFYCEENVWCLCGEIKRRQPAELAKCHVAFVSNQKRVVPLWRQRAGRDDDKLVIWDYHCVLIYQPDDRCVVYDLDSELPFPTYFHKYVTETFRTDQILKPEYFRTFRVVAAPAFLGRFASDRRHMRKADGAWLHEPPAYPPITNAGCEHNLDTYLEMGAAAVAGDSNGSDGVVVGGGVAPPPPPPRAPSAEFGELFSLTDLVKRFHQRPASTSSDPSAAVAATTAAAGSVRQ